MQKSKTISSYIDGKPTIVVMDGKIMENEMKKIRFRLTDLLEQMRQKDIFDLKEVQFAINAGGISMKKLIAYGIPVIVLGIFILIMTAGQFLKRPWTQEEDVVRYIDMITNDVKVENWKLAEEDCK